ncbi:NRDE family protein [Halomonas sp. GXIMD04776]|uniref:NRDE family protein n=1 Tax=Halomonas sp. GXIMD04776 TaxID=3415605 RepID=UPI003C8F39D0
MCLIVFDWRPGSETPLRLAANRDEFHARPTAALQRWKDKPDILGGRDLRAGGTWLAAHGRGRLAAVTNVRAPAFEAPADGPSRGELVRQALECATLKSWLAELTQTRARRYAGFNLLVSDGDTLWHLHHGPSATRLLEVAPGVHGLSNASLDTPWPKLLCSRERLANVIADVAADDDDTFAAKAWSLMADERPAEDARLPDTGVSLDLERFLSAPFIVGEEYGTRASTWVSWQAEGNLTIGERSFGPLGRLLDERRERLAMPLLPI